MKAGKAPGSSEVSLELIDASGGIFCHDNQLLAMTSNIIADNCIISQHNVNTT